MPTTRRSSLLVAVALILAGFIPAGLVAGWVSSSRAGNVKEAAIITCNALNSTVRQINEQNTAFLLHNEVTRDTFAADPNSPALRKAAHLYSEIGAAYKVLPQIDCRRAADSPESYVLPRSRPPTRAELVRAERKYLSVHRSP